MFCDGKCIDHKKDRRCGLFTELIVEEKGKEGQPVTKQLCMFQAILDSLIRIEIHQGGLHAAMNSTRNVTASNIQELTKTIKDELQTTKGVFAHGFLGIIEEARKASKQDPAKLEQKTERTGLS